MEKENSGFDSGDATNQQARLEGMHEQALWEERSGKRPRSPLVSNALNQALSSRHTAAGIIFHSDRGSQYGSAAYRQILSQRLDRVFHGDTQTQKCSKIATSSTPTTLAP